MNVTIETHSNFRTGPPTRQVRLKADTTIQRALNARANPRADKVLPPGRPDEVGPNGGQWIPPEGWRAR